MRHGMGTNAEFLTRVPLSHLCFQNIHLVMWKWLHQEECRLDRDIGESSDNEGLQKEITRGYKNAEAKLERGCL